MNTKNPNIFTAMDFSLKNDGGSLPKKSPNK